MTKALDPLALVGTTVSDKYQIEQVADEGGFAIVYRATHNLWKRPVAIKVFRTMGDLGPERREHPCGATSQADIDEGHLVEAHARSTLL